MYVKEVGYTNRPEFLVAEHHVCFTKTAVKTGLEADDTGKIYFPKGALIDAEGKIVTVESGTPSTTPIGITFNTEDVTYGPQPMAVLVEGYINADRLYGDGVPEYVKSDAFKALLPKITVM